MVEDLAHKTYLLGEAVQVLVQVQVLDLLVAVLVFLLAPVQALLLGELPLHP